MTKKRELCYDFSYNVALDPEYPPPVGVIQIVNSKDSTIYWQSFSLIDPAKKTNNYPIEFQIEFNIERLQDSSFYIKSYFWNNRNGRIQISNLDAHQYQLSDCY
jgi:hypothetical protein